MEDALKRRIEIASGIDVVREKQRLKREMWIANTANSFD